MKYKLLSNYDLKAIDSLIEFHGGREHINRTIAKMRDFETRKKILSDKGYGPMIADAESLVKKFPKFPDLERKLKVTYDLDKGVGRSQVSGFQGSGVTYQCMKRMAETSIDSEPCFVPAEMISVVPLTDHYVYSGDLMATLAMSENIMKTTKFCSTNLIGIPHPESRFLELEKVTGDKFDRRSIGDGLSHITLKNQGTAFGNLGGIEVANNHHLFYLDGIIRTALENGANFFLNPSWSTIIAGCYFGREIPNLSFKVSMLLSTQNTLQLRMLLNIMSEYIRDDGTSPIYEINIGNGTTAETFIQCSRELDESGIKGVSLAAHIFINPDLGMPDFNWTDHAFNVLESGTNLTYKYESDGTAREMDTMAAYFLSDEERDEAAEKIGDVIFYKALQASRDGIKMMKRGIRPEFGGSSF